LKEILKVGRKLELSMREKFCDWHIETAVFTSVSFAFLLQTDRAAMIDEIVDYVKFLRLQVKVLSMSRLGGAGAVAPLVTEMPLSSSVEDETQAVWEKWSNDGTERQVAKLMEENVGAAMQLLQSKALCIMPISLAMAIYHSQPPDTSSSIVKPEMNPPP
jgi:hypothetical protein